MHSSPEKQMVRLALKHKISHATIQLCMYYPYIHYCIHDPFRPKYNQRADILQKQNLAYWHTSILGTISLEHICVLRDSRISPASSYPPRWYAKGRQNFPTQKSYGVHYQVCGVPLPKQANFQEINTKITREILKKATSTLN